MSSLKLHALLVGIALSISFTSGCIGQEHIPDKQSVTFEQLFSAPEKYHEKSILIEGFIFLGFETMVLCEELEYSGYYEGHLVPGERMLWFEGGIPTEIYDQLQEQNMPGDYGGMAPLEKFGKLEVKGIFEYGGQYGHLGMYKYQITPSEIQLLTWSAN
jgi:hypothetical protein